MKKLLSILLCIFMLSSISYSESAEYSPALDTTMSKFISNYNALGSSLESSLIALKLPMDWTKFEGNDVAWFRPDMKSDVRILLISKDKRYTRHLSGGLDEIQIFTSNASDFPAIITIVLRCTKLFASELLGISVAPLAISEVISYYYENNFDNTDYSSYRVIDIDEKYILKFWHSDSYYYFSICENAD